MAYLEAAARANLFEAERSQQLWLVESVTGPSTAHVAKVRDALRSG